MVGGNGALQNSKKYLEKRVREAAIETFPFLVSYLSSAGGKVIETEYWVRRQMEAICLLGELSIHPTQFIGGIFIHPITF